MRRRTDSTRQKSASTWTCPEFLPLTPQEIGDATRLYEKIAADNALPSTSIDAAGIELRAALMILQEQRPFPMADNGFWKRKCQALFLRPAIEPIACTYWGRFLSFDLDETSALKIASAMAGRPLVYRKGPATGRSLNGDVHFEPLGDPGRWLRELIRAANTPSLIFGLPIYCFAQTIMTHPFSDGNGRFARLMVHGALARCAGLDGPRIALAPAFYRRAEALASALTVLSETGDWSELNEVFFAALGEALALTRSLASAC